MSANLKGKHIILGITGGIAAYKSVMLLRLLIKAGAEVQVVITPNGKEFITPVTLSALSGKPVVSEFFSANTGEWHSHVDLGLWADAMVVAPATASSIAKMANGVADNMLITTYLSAKAPVFIAPAMDLDMMAHPSTTRNLELLRSYGNHIIEAASGELASHLTGKGRMEEPEKIVEVLDRFFAKGSSLRGKRVMITAGPTIERIDPVRYIGNFSTGKMGYALAEEAASRGAEVILVSGPVAIEARTPGIKVVKVESALEMLAACKEAFKDSDIAIMAAAVADYRPANPHDHKIKREHEGIDNIELIKNPDIAAALGAEKRDGQKLVGFALETDHALENGGEKLSRKNLDMIVVNSLADKGAGFGTDTNKVTLLFREGRAPESFPLKSKTAVASDILEAILSL
ncbi:MAG: bifunctional phosphopantothenoylcysteine decarboxylase/phosphopantothenate--cysteine ligase CoaBC [Muribaculaceae bacterium]|nr:bifunctional phosphopantothenoylcysteine decarboxylase/phosphopantothenate--cysteine ligase CoaBC [Muribaculaceae bacterium]